MQAENQAGNNTQPVTSSSELQPEGAEHFTNLLNAYYGLKDAMIEGDATSIGIAAKKVSLIASELEGSLDIDSVKKEILQPYIDTIRVSAHTIIAQKDETAEHQRIIFEQTSNAMYGAIKAAGYKSNQLYRQYCPMAMNDKGAYWLSNETEIRNPYFGSKMLECGEITDTLN